LPLALVTDRPPGSGADGASVERRATSPLSLALALAPGTLLAGVAGGIAFPILPIVALREGLSLGFIGVILAANRAMRVVSSPWIGAYADRFGGRRTLLAGLVVQFAVLVLYALGVATHQVGPLFLAGRLLHGPGSACVFIAAQALALHAGGTSHSGQAAGMVRIAIVLGIPLGLSAGGILSEALGNTVTFLIAAGAVLLSLVAALAWVPDLRVPVRQQPSFVETLRAMRDRRLLAVGILNLVVNFAAAGMILTTLALLVHDRHLKVFSRNEQGTAGLLMAIMIVVDASTAPIAGRIGDRLGAHARVATFGMVLLSAGLAVIGLSHQAGGVGAGLALVGLGTAGLSPSLLVLMGRIVPQERRGAGAGILQLCGDVGGVLGPLVGTALLAGNSAVPYVGTAAVVLLFLPVTQWLARVEQ
jgi:MFS family permease